MKLEVNFNIQEFEQKALQVVSKNRIVLSSAVVLVVCGFVLLRINSLTATELDESHKSALLEEINTVDFDQDSIDAISNLNNSSVEITSDFTDRNNPFVD